MENPLEDHVNDRPHEEVPDSKQRKTLGAKSWDKKGTCLITGDEEWAGK